MKQRLFTGLIIVALALLVIFGLPVEIASAIFALITLGALAELIHLVRQVLPSAPLRSLYLSVPALAAVGVWALRQPDVSYDAMAVLGLLAALTLFSVASVIFGGANMKDAVGALGILTFVAPCFALPIVAFYWLLGHDRWWVVLVVALIGMGDTLAYFVGRAWGKHRLAPVISPKKTWEGAVAGLLASVATAALWSWWHQGSLDPRYLWLAAGTAVVGQLGDLAESLIKRGAGIKDSSNLLPGHGGLYDRLDALILAVPVFAFLIWLLGLKPGL